MSSIWSSLERGDRARDAFERLALGPDPDRQLDDRRADHQRGAEQIAEKYVAAVARSHQGAEQPGRGNTTDRRADRVEERDRERARLQWEALADRQIGSARRCRREKEDAAPASGQCRGIHDALAEQPTDEDRKSVV